MKIIRYLDPEDKIRFAALQDDGGALVIRGDSQQYEVTDEVADVRRMLSPVDARVILGIGMNYLAHIQEMGKALPEHPVLFMKNPSAVVGDGAPIILPRKARSDKVDYEAELAVVIGRVARNVSREDALNYVLGYTCANDVSARDWQLEWNSGQFCKGKGFDTFCPLGPCLVTTDELTDPSKLTLRAVLNGEEVQNGPTSDMIFDVPALIEFLSASTTLIPGTVILTGTPPGVGAGRNPQRFLQPGDEIAIGIDEIGTLTNRVVEEDL